MRKNPGKRRIPELSGDKRPKLRRPGAGSPERLPKKDLKSRKNGKTEIMMIPGAGVRRKQCRVSGNRVLFAGSGLSRPLLCKMAAGRFCSSYHFRTGQTRGEGEKPLHSLMGSAGGGFPLQELTVYSAYLSGTTARYDKPRMNGKCFRSSFRGGIRVPRA